MEIILKDDVKGLGYKNDLVKVKDGYARNYLIPQRLAVLANASNKKMLAENLKQAAHKADKILKDAQALADSIQAATITVFAKVSETGKIFGSVTNIQLADALQKNGIEIDRRKISFKQDEVKSAGDYVATVDLHREIKATLKFSVVAE
jgi:large subunit ribosomal protein L9